MDHNQPEPTLEESIKEVMQGLPPVIRKYLVEERYTQVVKNLTGIYGLRIDQAGTLERETMLLLMGIETPDEFVKALIEEARMNMDTAHNITQDINNQIFIPLRKEEEAQSKKPQGVQPAVTSDAGQIHHAPLTTAAPEAPRPAEASSVGGPRVVAPRPVDPNLAPLPPRFLKSEATIKIQVGSRNHEPPPKVSAPASTMKPSSLGDAVRAAIAAPVPPAPNTLLEDHEEPSPVIAKAPSVTPAMPTPPVMKPPAPPMQVSPRVVPPPAPVAPLPRPESAPLKSYGDDPYREPIDDVEDEM